MKRRPRSPPWKEVGDALLKRMMLMFLVAVVLVGSVALPAFSQEATQGGGGKIQAAQEVAEDCTGDVEEAGKEFLCTNGLFSGAFLPSGPSPSGLCTSTSTIDWGDGNVEEAPTSAVYDWILVPHQYSKP